MRKLRHSEASYFGQSPMANVKLIFKPRFIQDFSTAHCLIFPGQESRLFYGKQHLEWKKK